MRDAMHKGKRDIVESGIVCIHDPIFIDVLLRIYYNDGEF